MIFLPVLVATGSAYLSYKVSHALKKNKAPPLIRQMSSLNHTDVQRTERNVVVASVSLSLATTGVLLRMPAMGLASVPMMLYVFMPTIKDAWVHVSEEHKINVQVLIATRVAVCVSMGFTFIAALDALCHASSQRFFLKQQEETRQLLAKTYHQTGQIPDGLYDIVEHACFRSSELQQRGERQGEQSAPWMLVACVVATPLMGVNRAAAFLTTTFGAHLHRLGPYTQQHAVRKAMRQGILLTEPDVLERMLTVDTLIFDHSIFKHSSQRVQAKAKIQNLRARCQQSNRLPSLALVLCLEEDDQTLGHYFVEDIGFDSCINVNSAQDKAQWIKQLQGEGRTIAYVSNGQECADEKMHSSGLTLTLCLSGDLDFSIPHVIFLGTDLDQLPELFDLAASSTKKQQFNFVAPIVIDCIDISTTVFFDFGLVYSILFTYSGLLVGVINTRAGARFNKDQEPIMSPLIAFRNAESACLL